LVVLWSRQSGALGGLHPEHDSSYQALAQLVELFDSQDKSVMLVGDDPGSKLGGRLRLNDEGTKLEIKVDERFRKAVRLGEFWSRSGLRGKPRTAQFAFFEHLRQLVPTLTHVGMRSGNLEAYAYMGHRVIFLEEEGRTDAVRMDKIVGQHIHLKYSTVKLGKLPTRTGQVLMDKALRDKFYARIAKYRKLIKALGKKNTASAKLAARLGQNQLQVIEAFTRLEAALEQSSLPAFQKELSLYRFFKKNDNDADDEEAFSRTVAALDTGFTDDDIEQILEAMGGFSFKADWLKRIDDFNLREATSEFDDLDDSGD
jgi:hypothetical protein